MNKTFIFSIVLFALLFTAFTNADIKGMDSIEPTRQPLSATLSSSNPVLLRSKRYGYYGYGYGGCCCCGGYGGYGGGYGPFGVGLFGVAGGLLFGGYGK